jgi:glycosyltransferase involved in cell wall biosynthesis
VEQSNQPYRLAMWTPLPPLKNGIAEYAVELIEALSTVYDIEVFVDKGYTPNALLNKRLQTFVYTEFETRHNSHPFDIIIYQVGTSHQHFYMFPAIRKYQGVVVLHDGLLGQAVYKYYYDQDNLAEFRRLIADELGQSGLEQFNRLYRSKDRQRFIEFMATIPAMKWLIDASAGQIVHMKYVRDEIEKRYANAHVYSFPMGVKSPHEIVPESTASLRQKFSLDPTTFVIGVLGRITATKSYNLIIEAVRDLVIDHPNILLVIVGTQGNFAQFDHLQLLLERYGLANHVHFSGFVDETSFTQLTMICDVVINLRYPSQYQLSRTLMNAIAAGKPSIISDIPEWSEFPDEICLRINHEVGEQIALTQLKSHLQNLILDPTLRRRMSDRADQYFEQHLTMCKMLENYNNVLIASFNLDKTKLSSTITHAQRFSTKARFQSIS